MLYTLADLTRITGAKRRTVQLWAEAGVIRARPATERGGTGVHRQFSIEEAFIACVMTAFVELRMGIGTLLKLSKLLRGTLKETPGLAEQIAMGNVFARLLVRPVKGELEMKFFWLGDTAKESKLDLRTIESWISAINVNKYAAGLKE
jgi:hypothetical protein